MLLLEGIYLNVCELVAECYNARPMLLFTPLYQHPLSGLVRDLHTSQQLFRVRVKRVRGGEKRVVRRQVALPFCGEN